MRNTRIVNGHIDNHRRLIVRLSFLSNEDELIGMIDTRFSGFVMMDIEKARALRLQERRRPTNVLLANGEDQVCRVFDAHVKWGEQVVNIDVWSPIVNKQVIHGLFIDGQPDCLIGTAFLDKTQLSADFNNRKVTVVFPNLL